MAATSTSVSPSSSSVSAVSSDEKKKLRVVICGGGVIGACTAYFLAVKSGGRAAITVVERSSVACAASGKAGGFLALDWCSGPLADLARQSFILHKSLSETLDGRRSYNYRPLHTFSLTIPSCSNSSSSSRSPILPNWIDGAAVGAQKTIGTVETTAQVHPKLFTEALLAAAAADGAVEVVIGEVVRVLFEGSRAVGVALKDGQEIVGTDAVVLALGPWSGRLELVSSFFSVSGVKAHSIVLRPHNPGAITPHALFLSYRESPDGEILDPEVYPRPNGEVYICGMSREAKVPEDPESVAGDPSLIEVLHRVAESVSSELRRGTVEVTAEQACFLPWTDDGLPAIGELPGAPGCYVATGHGCWGILNAPATGASLAELLLDGRASIVDLAPFSPARFVAPTAKSRAS